MIRGRILWSADGVREVAQALDLLGAAEHRKDVVDMDPQGFIWHELMSRDPTASEGFYEKVIGVVVQRVADAPGDYRLLLVDGRPFAGMTGPRSDSAIWPSGGPEGHWVPYFGTDDVEAAVGRAKSGGGIVLVEPVDIPGWGRAAVLRDPDGATFGVYQPA